MINLRIEQKQFDNYFNKSYSRMNDDLDELFFKQMIDSLIQNKHYVDLEHMITVALTYNQNQLSGKKALLKYLCPVFDDELIDDLKQWQRPTQNEAIIPTRDYQFNGKRFSGFVLNLSKLSYHQRMNILIHAPRFALTSCVISVNNKLFKLMSINDVIRSIINFHIQEWNLEKNEAARKQAGINRNQPLQGQVYQCQQRSVNWNFLTETIDAIKNDNGFKDSAPKVLISYDKVEWFSHLFLCNQNKLALRKRSFEPYSFQRVPETFNGVLNFEGEIKWFKSNVQAEAIDLNGVHEVVNDFIIYNDNARIMRA